MSFHGSASFSKGGLGRQPERISSAENAGFAGGCGKGCIGFSWAQNAIERIQAMLERAAVGAAAPGRPAAQELDRVPCGGDDIFLALFDGHSNGGGKAYVTQCRSLTAAYSSCWTGAPKRTGLRKVPARNGFSRKFEWGMNRRASVDVSGRVRGRRGRESRDAAFRRPCNRQAARTAREWPSA